MNTTKPRRRVFVVDDQPVVHQAFDVVFAERAPRQDQFDAIEAAFFLWRSECFSRDIPVL